MARHGSGSCSRMAAHPAGDARWPPHAARRAILRPAHRRAPRAPRAAQRPRRCADLIVPPCCLVCRAPRWRAPSAVRGLLARCATSSAPPLCDVLGIPLPFDTGGRTVSRRRRWPHPPAYDRARAVAHFSGAMRTLVHQFKYADRHDAAHAVRPLAGRGRPRAAARHRCHRARCR